MSTQNRIFVSLGANLGEPVEQLRDAARRLASVKGFILAAKSSFYLTEPIGPIAQPDFVNAAVEIRSGHAPGEVLRVLLEVEQRMGRERSGRWGPRRIDLDLLLYGRSLCDAPGLHVPHPRMHERRFVLAPLAEIAPEVRHPVLGKTAQELLEALRGDETWVKRLDEKWDTSPIPSR
ncbi:MAG: 2-amino-4-hydroxy-6-hydroxymethyldihydropteridine diphosphokinase [bacterium]|nr:2-amino-4-hydroxy-6-hydroxymethyldihydropteridine diphosphokinase [bacterium]